MAKKLYKLVEKETGYRVYYVWAEDLAEAESIPFAHLETIDAIPFENEGYIISGREVKDDEEVDSDLILNPEDEE